MQEPYYVRSEDYLYCLRSNRFYGWWTGLVGSGKQMLLSPPDTLIFDAEGNLETCADRDIYPISLAWYETEVVKAETNIPWVQELGFVEGPIYIKRFWLPDIGEGIEDIVDGAEVYEDPVEYQMVLEDRKGWINDGMYVFHCNNDYYVNRNGKVESS